MLMYCSGPQKMDVLKTFSISNELRIIFLTLQIWFFLIKIILIFFPFFTEKVWKLFGTILMKIFCSFFFFNNILGFHVTSPNSRIKNWETYKIFTFIPGKIT